MSCSTSRSRRRHAGELRQLAGIRPDELQHQQEQAATSLPPADQEAVARSAGEGMVATPIEAATQPTQHLSTTGWLLASNGQPIVAVKADVLVVPPVWSATLEPIAGQPTLAATDHYHLRLADGTQGRVRLTSQTSTVYNVVGDGPLQVPPAERAR